MFALKVQKEVEKKQRHLSSDTINLCTTASCYFPSAVNHTLICFSSSCSNNSELASSFVELRLTFNFVAAFLHVSTSSLSSILTGIYLRIVVGPMAAILVLSILCIPKLKLHIWCFHWLFSVRWPTLLVVPRHMRDSKEEGTPPRTWKLKPRLEDHGGEWQKLDSGGGGARLGQRVVAAVGGRWGLVEGHWKGWGVITLGEFLMCTRVF